MVDNIASGEGGAKPWGWRVGFVPAALGGIFEAMSEFDVLWKQRLQNFDKVMDHLETALRLPAPDLIQKAGIVQFFEMSFELAWNTLKDFLEDQGYQELRSPRAALKKGFEIGLLEDGHGWMQALEDRNLTSHTYDEATADQVLKLVRDRYHPLLAALRERLHRDA